MSSYYGTWNVYNMPIFSSAKSFQDVVSETLGFENTDLDVLTVKALPPKSDRHPNGVDPAELVDGVLNDLGSSESLMDTGSTHSSGITTCLDFAPTTSARASSNSRASGGGDHLFI
eukprot:CAMPEP_0202959976 /NCGR_PEP_ID=MMETSP1396-20130829/4172_1 /ASSEMBLY_ACC=CAM_ASM_000872 /TAXON_ID= /ORGANISM="Pseudokeronopsis sp., Strain Brazil" /LENGTH=115 /DNA_ID=CAMNT_0049678917 /DNA_START=567 /DNA_END=915 /DNA_ORIENTATION=+